MLTLDTIQKDTMFRGGFEMNCELCGCIYNDDGRCIYNTSSIRIECACACYNDDYSEEE